MVCNVKLLIVSMSLWILAAANCNEPFQCGGIMYIQYPFWGVSRGKECGHDGFEIICDGGSTPLLNISSLFYRILQIDFATNTLKLSRQDLLTNNACGLHLRNTTMDPNLFTHPPNSTERNLTIYVDCAGKKIETLPNTIGCDNSNITNLFKTGEPSSGPGSGVTCRNNIFVPVNYKDALALKNPTPSSINILRSALDSGFYIQWLNLPDPKRPRRGLQPPVQSPVPPPESRVHGQILDHPRPEARKSPAEKIAIVVAFTVTGVIILSISIYCFLNRRHSANIHTPECKQDVEKFLLQQGSLIPKKYKYSEIKKMTKSLSDKLGQGGYGSVYKGMLPDGTPVSVKVLIETDSNGEEFINEVASISRTSHINIVTLLGFSYEGKRRALVYEFMPNYSLDKFLNQSQSAGSMDYCLNMEKLYKIALGIAKGLQYLHTGCITRIVHFDIKPQNILLDENLCPKISDFGLAKLCKKKQSILSVLGTRGTIGYIAPEVFSRNFGGVSHKSDVYSYGMMLLEIAGARKVDEVEVIQSSENYFPDKIYEQVIIDVTKKLDDLMTEEEEETRIKMILVGFWCIQTIPSSRPSISKVVEMLEGSLQSIQIPPKPFLSTPNLPTLEVSSSLSAYLEIENSS